MHQPSDEALKRMIDFLLKTSVPRILEREANNQQTLASNERQEKTISIK
ncbi:hypothetical protein MTP04_22850 [Lysinibacillus sp. PLM2]|nr:hypothetical protein MTP04_22850 [Lysinibacillus sp. PLM2]